jgi:aspartyl-tRNA(Asn)/glutamyl-tRNA(Gln) amidotransferase subunit B
LSGDDDDDEGESPTFQMKIGLEVHVQLDSRRKLFSSAPVASSSAVATPQHNLFVPPPPNSSFDPHDAAVPGYLPRLAGEESVRHAVVASTVGCHATVQPVSRFERKHYAYADLPHGYQITQQRWPFAMGGWIPVVRNGGDNDDDDDTVGTHDEHDNYWYGDSLNDDDDHDENDGAPPAGRRRRICRIARIQLEMDTAKTLQTTMMAISSSNVVGGGDGGGGDKKTAASSSSAPPAPVSLVDLDRAGIGLIEIVTEPDLHSPNEAWNASRYLHSSLTGLGVTRGRMQHGEFRVDVNVNLVHPATGKQATGRVEVKNLNSHAQVRDAALYEAKRQAQWFIDSRQRTPSDDDGPNNNKGNDAEEETRTWDASANRTVLIRRKDSSRDYRFLPEPDLPPLVLDPQWVRAVQKAAPELPGRTAARIVERYGISRYQSWVLVREASFDAARLFEEACKELLPSQEERPEGGGDDDAYRGEILNRHRLSGSQSRKVVAVANLICNDLFALIHSGNAHAEATSLDSRRSSQDAADPPRKALSPPPPLAPAQLAEIVLMLQEDTISTSMAKKLLSSIVTLNNSMASSAIGSEDPTSAPATHVSLSPRRLAKERGWQLITDREELIRICRCVLQDQPEQVVEYHDSNDNDYDVRDSKSPSKDAPRYHRQKQQRKKNRQKLIKLLMGKAMAASGGNAHPERLQEALREVLEESR